jgi:hypothetical protein
MDERLTRELIKLVLTIRKGLQMLIDEFEEERRNASSNK